MLILCLLQNTAARYFFLQVITLLLLPFYSIHKPEFLLSPQFPLYCPFSQLISTGCFLIASFFANFLALTPTSQKRLQTTTKLLAERFGGLPDRSRASSFPWLQQGHVAGLSNVIITYEVWSDGHMLY